MRPIRCWLCVVVVQTGLLTPASVFAQDSGDPAVLKYVPKNAVAGLFLQPQRALQCEHVQELIKASQGEEAFGNAMEEAERELGIDPRIVKEFAVFVDRVDAAEPPADAAPKRDVLTLTNNLKQFALAMHNMHDVYGSFPADDGVDNPDKGNLSWRVHMLPYLDHAPLYNQFRQTEPWDSEHNKALINKMPDIFKTPGVEEAGKTSLHLFTGEGAPFHDNSAPRLRDILDGSSNTILCVIAGADKAEIWTKPGGLDFDVKNPIAAVGEMEDSLLVAMMDGSVQEIPLDINPQTLANLIQNQDGNVVDFNGGNGRDFGRDFSNWPAFFVRTTEPIDKDDFLAAAFPPSNEPKTQTIAGLEAQEFRGMWVVFPDDRTMLAAPEDLLKRALEKRAEPTLEPRIVDRIKASDAFAFGDFDLVKELIGGDLRMLPMAGVVENLVSAEYSVDVSNSQLPLQDATIKVANAVAAQQVSALVQGGLQMANAQMLAASTQPGSPVAPELAQELSAIINGMNVSVDDSTVHVVVPKPKDMNTFVARLAPAMKLMAEQNKRAQRMNSLKQIGLAFHNYHDVYGHFPFSDRGPDGDPDQKVGLSWRVYILPFVEEAGLYEQFHLDEPWDSEHNKTLIDRMPDVYKVEGVTKAGHTSMHVFTGEGTPFDGDTVPRIQNFLDGTSNTLLVVQAGADTADVWTKPGGLEFDLNDPKKCLGKIGEEFLSLFADGSVRQIPGDIDNPTLSNLIQPDDGNPVPDF